MLNRVALREQRKVFAIGFNKSGITSPHALFESFGLVSYHGTRWRDCADLTLLRSYDCFSDDIPKDLAKLDRLFSGAKFILQVRDLDTWVYSRLAHIERRKRDAQHKGNPIWDTTEERVMLQEFLPNETQTMRGLKDLEEDQGQTAKDMERRGQGTNCPVGATGRGQYG